MRSFLLPLLFVLTLCTCVRAQIPYLQLSPRTTTQLSVATTNIEITYSRPSMRGRKIFGGLEPWDVVWRGGANLNPKLTMSNDFYFGDTPVKAGSYTIFSKPNPDRWTVYLYTEVDWYGVPEKWDEEKVVATLEVVPQALPRPRETLSYTFDEVTNDRVTLVLEWETTRITLPLGLTTSEEMEASIAKTLGGPDAADYSNAALYYLRNDKDLNQALAWFDKAIALDKTPSYWEHLFRAKTLENLGRPEDAKAGAMVSLELARKSDSDYGVRESEALLERLQH